MCSEETEDILFEARLNWSYRLVSKTLGLYVLFPFVDALMSHSNFRLYFTPTKLAYIYGGFAVKHREIPLLKINDITVKTNLGRDVGDIYIMTGHEKAEPIKSIERPHEFKKQLMKAIKGL